MVYITGQFLAIVDCNIKETFTYLAINLAIYSYKIQLCIIF